MAIPPGGVAATFVVIPRSHTTDQIERRDFLKGAAGAAVAAAGLAMMPSRVLGANERIVAGFIGTGRQGRDNMKAFLKQENVEVAALCDVYDVNLNKGALIAGEKAQKVKDFRRILENKDINTVCIATPDHWHALMTTVACEANKDVYVEKPISVTVEEGRKMVEAARRYEQIVQVGTMQRSGVHFQKAVEIVRSGRLGPISLVRTWNYGNSFPEGQGNPPDSEPFPGLDWDMWLGPARKVPFNANRFGVGDRWSSFRYFWDYAGGMMTDWGVHLLDIVQWAMNVNAPQFLGNVAYRSRKRIQWNADAEKVGDLLPKHVPRFLGPGAMFLSRAYRKPWKL